MRHALNRSLRLFPILFGFVAPARAETLVLQQTGAWHDPKAWDLQRTPAAGDDAVIPAGRVCTLGPLGLARARTVQVDGELILDRETLVLGSDDPDVDVICMLNGRIVFQDEGDEDFLARIVPDGGWVRFEGTGELYASRASGGEHQGRLRCCAVTGPGPCDQTAGKGFVIEAGVTARGSLHLHACLVLEGDWIVDHPQDRSHIGLSSGMICGPHCTEPLTLSGSGRFIVRAGELDIGEVEASDVDAPRIVHEGGCLRTQTALKVRFKTPKD